jgi:hypothetical protein
LWEKVIERTIEMIGLIATIIAAAKGKSTFAWVTGIWTAFAFALALSGYINIAIAPGWIFLIAAISMKKEPTVEKIRVLVYCPSCSTIGYCNSDDSIGICPHCGHVIVKTQVTSKAWHEMSTDQRNEYRKEWGIEITKNDSKKKFICESCGTYNDGWYKVCPECGAVGKMKKADELLNPIEPIIKPSEDTAASASKDELSLIPTAAQVEANKIMFCRECGSKLNADSIFCPECGTRILETEATVENVVPQNGQKHEVPVDKLPARLRRAFIFIEDEEWDKAGEYIETFLDEEPENPYAYLGKLMVEYKATTLEQLSEKDGISDSKNYKRAMRYANDELSGILNSLTEK